MSTTTTHIKTDKQLVPTLRFDDFTMDWAKNSSSIQIVAGNAYSLDDYVDKGITLVQGLNIGPGKLKLDNSYYLSESLKGSHITLKKGDILLGLNRPITNGKLKICKYDRNQKAYLYQRAGKLEFNTSEINSEFLYQILRSDYFLKKTTIELVGSDQPYIRSNLFKIVKLWFPKFPEQQKIASFLSAVDEKIQQLTKKKKLLEQYKKGVMQKLLSQELRFPEFTGDYEENRLSQLLTRYSKNNKDEEFGIDDILSLSSKYGIVDRKELLQDTYSKVNHLNYIKTRMNDFVYAKSISANAPFGVFKANLCRDGLLSTLYYTFKVKEKADPLFLEYYFSDPNRANNFLRKFVLVGDRYITADADYILSGKIQIPTLPEQQKIATYLSRIDTKIEAVTNQTTQTQTFKKGLLQQMFV